MVTKATKPVLFDFLDYREYLRAYHFAAKNSRAGFSLRRFSEKAGFGSSNFFKLVMDGDRNLTKASATKFAIGLALNKQETEFFLNLVFYTQAKTHEEKDRFYQKMLQSRKYRQLKPVSKERYEFYSRWYHAVIRELVLSHDFDGSIDWLRERISPRLTTDEIESSIELLEDLGFIVKSDCGWQQSNPILTTGSDVLSNEIVNYHKEMLHLSLAALDNVSLEKRDISSMTLGIKRERLSEIKEKVIEFRKEILKLVSTEDDPETVVMLNMQLFPVAESKKERE